MVHREISKGVGMFTILLVMMVSQVYTYIETHQIMCSLLYVNYTLRKWYLKLA